MKNTNPGMKRRTAGVLALALSLSTALSACGGGGNKVTYEDMGYYTIYAMETEDETYKRKDLKAEGLDGIYLWLDEDGEGELYYLDESYDLTWQDGKILDLEGKEAEYELDGGKLSFETKIEKEKVAFTFKYKDEELPDDAGVASNPKEDTLVASKDDEKEDKEDSNQKEEKEDKPSSSRPSGNGSADYIGFSGDIAGSHVEVVGAQWLTDSDGRDAVRLFIDFTNGSEETTSAYSELYPTLSQGGVKLNSTYISSMSGDVAEEDDNWMRDVRPGVTIRCSKPYVYNAQGGDIEVSFSQGYGNNKEELTFTMNPDSFVPDHPGSVEIPKIDNPKWVSSLPEGIGLESDEVKYNIIFTKTESTTSYRGDQLIRVYYEVENLGSETLSSYHLGSDVRAFQDGVELQYGSSKDSVNEERNYGMDLEPGDKMTFAECFTLISESPVEVEVYTYGEGAVAGIIARKSR